MRLTSIFLSLAVLCAPASAMTVKVVDASGAPVANAVVTFETAGATPSDYGQEMKVSQEDIMFHPYVLVVPVGADVEFPNLDRVRHHVYSFSKGNRFELELYGREAHRSVKFKQAGTVAIGCNIHDMMVSYIRVVDAPFAGVTGEDGTVEIRNLPDTVSSGTVWQPDMSGGKSVNVAANPSGEMMELDLRTAYVAPPPGAEQ